MSCLGVYPAGNAMTQLYVLLIGHLGLTKGRQLGPGLNLEAVLQRSLTFKAFLTLSVIRLIYSGFGPDIYQCLSLKNVMQYQLFLIKHNDIT